MSEEEILLRKMALNIQRKLISRQQQSEEKVDYLKVFLDSLSEDGKEMYKRALDQYPSVAPKIAEELGRLIASGKITSPLDSETIYYIFMEYGYPIRIETKIVYKEKGKVKSISEVLKEKE